MTCNPSINSLGELYLPLPTVTLTVDATDIAEAGGLATITATMSEAAAEDIIITLGITGTATDVTDYTLSATSITLSVGSTIGTATITAVQDNEYDPEETIIVNIS